MLARGIKLSEITSSKTISTQENISSFLKWDNSLGKTVDLNNRNFGLVNRRAVFGEFSSVGQKSYRFLASNH